jgi:hypothetical protein
MMVTPGVDWRVVGSNLIEEQKWVGVIALQWRGLQCNASAYLLFLRLRFAAANFSSSVRLLRPGTS